MAGVSPPRAIVAEALREMTVRLERKIRGFRIPPTGGFTEIGAQMNPWILCETHSVLSVP